MEKVKTMMKKLKPLLGKEIPCEEGIYSVLEYICSLKTKKVPECYVDLIHEISKNTPVLGMIQSDSRIFLASLKSYLDKEVDVFDDKDILEHMNGEVPLLVNSINSVKVFEKTIYLPDPLVIQRHFEIIYDG